MRIFTRIFLVFCIALLSRPSWAENGQDSYPYREKCPSGDKSPDNQTVQPGGVLFGSNVDKWVQLKNDGKIVDGYWSSKYGFAQCNCVDYVASEVNRIWNENGFSGSFTNSFGITDKVKTYLKNQKISQRWGDAENWENVADAIGISRSDDPQLWDIAQWENLVDTGHVGMVCERRSADDIDICDYNYVAHDFRRKPYKKGDGQKWPDTFIHILPPNQAILDRWATGSTTNPEAIASRIQVRYAHGSYGWVAWESSYASCWDAPKVWSLKHDGILLSPVNKEFGCGFLDDFWNQGLLMRSEPSAGLLERSKQGLFPRATEGNKDSLMEAAGFIGLVQIAHASELTEPQYFGGASDTVEGILYKDGLLELVGTESVSHTYGPSDIQLSEGTPAFSGHPDHMGETDHDGKLPDMVVNDLWLRKKTSGSESHDHDFTVTDFYSDNVEWRVQAKNQGPGTKEKDKTVTVQVYLWKVRDDGDETKLEGVGKEEINKKLEPGKTTTESKSPDDFRRLVKYPGEYFVTTSLLTTDSFKEENKQNNFGGPYRFTVKNLSDLVVLSVSSSDGRSSYTRGEAASFHASFQLDGDRLPKKAKARVAWRLIGPSFPDGKIMETDRIKSTSLEDRRGNTHGENLEGVALDFLPGDYELQAIVNPECTLAETNCSNNIGTFRFRIEEPPPPPPDFPTDCGAPIPEPDFSTPPPLKTGAVGSVQTGNDRHRIWLQAGAAAVGGKLAWEKIAGFDPSKVTKICFNSKETNSGAWGVATSTACANGFVSQGNGLWAADISGTLPQAKGAWSFTYADGKEYWINPRALGRTDVDVENHVRYNGWRTNTVEFTTDGSRTTLTATLGNRSFSGIWFPDGSAPRHLTGKAFWFDQSTQKFAQAGTIQCDAGSGRFVIRIPGVAPGSQGKIVLELWNNPAGAGQMMGKDWWQLPAGATYNLDIPGGGAYTLGSPSVPGTEPPPPPAADFDITCGYAGVKENLDTLPPLKAGEVGSIRINGAKQRIIVRTQDMSLAGQKGMWGFTGFNPNSVTEVCLSSNASGWTVGGSSACADGFSFDPNRHVWTAEIPNGPLDALGTYSLRQDGGEHWFNMSAFGRKTNALGHFAYGGADFTQARLLSDGTLKLFLGGRHLKDFWVPEGFSSKDLNGKAYWTADGEIQPGVAGTVACDAKTRKPVVTIPGVTPGTVGTVTMGLRNTEQLAWNIPETDLLPAGATLVKRENGSRWRLPTKVIAFAPRVLFGGGTLAVDAASPKEMAAVLPGYVLPSGVRALAFQSDRGTFVGYSFKDARDHYLLSFYGVTAGAKGKVVATLSTGVKVTLLVGKSAVGPGIVADNANNTLALPLPLP